MRQTLRDYQERGLQQIVEAFAGGARAVLAIAPTGSGKTTLFGELTAQVPGNVLILVHRRELLSQACNRLREFGVDFGMIMAGEQPKPHARVQVASVQTLVRRKVPPATLIICDEAHLSTADSWKTILNKYPHAKILGVTATPWRLGGDSLLTAYKASVVVATPDELRTKGFLCQYNGFSYLAPDLSKVKTTAGEYNEKQSGEAMRQPQIVDNVVERWLEHASHLSTVVFAVTVEHSKELTARFIKAGVTAEHLDGATPIEQRRAILRRVAQGETRVLCNVGVAVEGLDIPRLKCCVLARPTKSLSRAIQMMGRVRRPWEGQTARIHDHAFVIPQHGLPDAPRDYSLHAKSDELPPSLTTCQKCMAIYSEAPCPSCGHTNEARILGERQELVTVSDAESFEFSSGAVTPQKPRVPVLVRWTPERIGKEISGVFTQVWEEDTAYGKQKRYRVSGKRNDYTLPGTSQFNAKMAKVKIGSRVIVKYLREVPTEGGRTLKEFSVQDEAPEDPAKKALKEKWEELENFYRKNKRCSRRSIPEEKKLGSFELRMMNTQKDRLLALRRKHGVVSLKDPNYVESQWKKLEAFYRRTQREPNLRKKGEKGLHSFVAGRSQLDPERLLQLKKKLNVKDGRTGPSKKRVKRSIELHVMALRKQGLDYTAIGRVTGISRTSVRAVLIRNKMKPLSASSAGSRCAGWRRESRRKNQKKAA